VEPQLDAMFIGTVSDRSGNHDITLGGDAHAEADGVHFDGDGDYIQIPNFKYYDGARWSFSMWIATDVCDPNDPTPSGTAKLPFSRPLMSTPERFCCCC
jgi:hypothetical protein